MEKKDNYSKTGIFRISQYKNALYRLQKMGFSKVFSDNLSDITGVPSAQIRKDFFQHGIVGSKKGGYSVPELLNDINKFLGTNIEQKVIVAGVGKMGSALIRYPGFKREGIRIVAGFDNQSEKWDRENEIPVLPLDEMTDYIKAYSIKNAILTVPDYAAQQIYERMAAAGICGILNFAPINLNTSDKVVVTNVNLAIELESLIFFASAKFNSSP